MTQLELGGVEVEVKVEVDVCTHNIYIHRERGRLDIRLG